MTARELFRLCLIWCFAGALLLLILLPGKAHAVTFPEHVVWSGGVPPAADTRFRTTAPVTAYTHARVPLTVGSVGRMAMGMAKYSAPWVALAGFLAAYDYIWDDENNRWAWQEGPDSYDGTSYVGYRGQWSSAPVCTNCNASACGVAGNTDAHYAWPSEEAVHACFDANWEGAASAIGGDWIISRWGPNTFRLRNGPTGGWGSTNYNYTTPSRTINTTEPPPWWAPELQPVTQEQLGTVIFEDLAQLTNVLRDAIQRQTWNQDVKNDLNQNIKRWQEMADKAAAIQAAIEAQQAGQTLTPEQEELLSRSSPHPGATFESSASASASVSVEVSVEFPERTCDPSVFDQCEPFELTEVEDYHTWADPIIEGIGLIPGDPLPAGLIEQPSGISPVISIPSGGSGSCQPFPLTFYGKQTAIDLCPWWPPIRSVLEWIIGVMTALYISLIWVDVLRRPV